MEKFTIHLVAPLKLQGLKEEIESINNFCGRNIYLQIVLQQNNLEDLQDAMAKAELLNPDFLLVFESITEERVSREKAQTELLEILRTVKFSSDSRIIVVLQEGSEHEELINELIKLGIQDFHITQGFTKDDIAGWLLNTPKTLKDNMQYLQTKIKNKQEKEIVVKEVIKYIQKEGGESSQLKEKNEIGRGKRKSVNIVGIIGASIGAGATSLCIELAEKYALQKQKVAVVERNSNYHLKRISSRKYDIYNDMLLHEIDLTKYDYILIDFGCYAEIDGKGEYIKKTLDLKLLNERNIEMRYCNNIILVCPGQEWRLDEVDFYISNVALGEETKDWIFYINGNVDNKSLRAFIAKNRSKRYIIVSSEVDAIKKLKEEVEGGM